MYDQKSPDSARPPLISEPHRMNAAWFTEVFNYCGYDVEVSAATSSPVGTGQSAHSERFRFEFSRWDNRAPHSLVAKLPAPDPTSRETGHVHGSYAREIGFYREIQPTVAVPVPQCIYDDFDPTDSDFVLLLQDMAPAAQGDQMQGCSVPVAQSAVATIAGLHGPRWGDESLAAHTFLGGLDGGPQAAAEMYDTFWSAFTERYADQLAPEIREVGEGLLQRYETYVRPYPGKRCVTHGDYRLDNVLIGGSAAQPTMHVVDWQTAGVGCGTFDVAYFLGAGLLPEVRRENEQALVQHYVEALQQHGVHDYTFEEAWHDYRWYTFSGYVMAVIASILVVQTARGDEMFMTMAHRHGQHAIDLNSLDLLT